MDWLFYQNKEDIDLDMSYSIYIPSICVDLSRNIREDENSSCNPTY